jgi:hypothetical protein
MTTAWLLCVNVAVILLSILSMRAKRENLLEGESADDGKLLLVTSEENITLASYLQRMTALVSDGPALQAAMMEYLYYARKRLIHRRRSLKLTYDIFIYGLAVSVALFVVAILRA